MILNIPSLLASSLLLASTSAFVQQRAPVAPMTPVVVAHYEQVLPWADARAVTLPVVP